MRHPIANYFSGVEAGLIQNLITSLISEAAAWDSKPSVMSQSERSRFMQEIHSRDGWIVIDEQLTEVHT